MHIGIIMDGNRRWAKNRGLPKSAGHYQGAKTLEKIVSLCPKYEIKTLTVYALSTENLKRSEQELDNLYKILIDFANKKTSIFQKEGVKAKVLGNLDLLRDDCASALKNLEKETQNGNKLLFQICIGYGGRSEITRAVQKLVESKEAITEENIAKNLDSNQEPDLIIRTGGDQRLSNFLTWQSTYSELMFLDKKWPSFNEKDMQKSIEHLQHQKRNFGK